MPVTPRPPRDEPEERVEELHPPSCINCRGRAGDAHCFMRHEPSSEGPQERDQAPQEPRTRAAEAADPPAGDRRSSACLRGLEPPPDWEAWAPHGSDRDEGQLELELDVDPEEAP